MKETYTNCRCHRITALSSVSLASGLLTNLLLFVNLGGYFPPFLVQVSTIVGIISSCLTAFIAILVFVLHSSHAKKFEFTQAFYYAIISVISYFVIAIFSIVISLGRYFHYYPKRFDIRESERKLLLQDFTFMTYLLIGALIFAKIEQWTYVDAVFWANFTLLTIGLGGSYTPTTSLARILLLPYAIGGIITLGVFVSSLRSVLERAKIDLRQQVIESGRRRMAEELQKSHHSRTEHMVNPSHQEFIEEEVFRRARKLKIEAGRKTRWFALLISILITLVLWLVGAAVFWHAMKSQQWTYPSALYFGYISLLTIGYGDLMPETNLAKPSYVFWTVISIPVLTIVISNLGDTIVVEFQKFLLFVGSITILPDPRILKTTIKKFEFLKQRNFKLSAKWYKLSEFRLKSLCEL